MGEKIDINDVTEYKKALEYYQRKGIECFDDNVEEWEMQKHINRLQRMRRYREKMRKAVEKRGKAVEKPRKSVKKSVDNLCKKK